MRIARLAVVVATLSGPAGQLAGQRNPPPAGFPSGLDAYIAKAVADWEVPGLAIAIVRNDSVLVAKGYGVRELGKPGRVDENTVFSIASLTKSFTATAAAMLVDDGRLQWDAPVRRYLPTLAFRDPYLTENVSIRDLLSHRTGLHASNMAWQMTGFDRAEMIRRARYLEPEAPFRTRQVYSNLGYLIAGEAIAAAAGMPYEEVVRQRIFAPLGMRSTSIGDAAAARSTNRVMPHVFIGGVQRPIPWSDIDVIAAAGSVNSTATDMAQWLRFQLRGDGTFGGRRLVSPEALWETHFPQTVVPVTAAMKRARLVEGWPGYAMGWNVMDYRGHPLLWHTGNADGQPAMMAVLPQDRIGVVVMMNTWGAGLLHALLVNRILDEYLGYPPRDWSGEALPRKAEYRMSYDHIVNEMMAPERVSGTAPSHPLAAYAGVYVDSLYGAYAVTHENGRLTLRIGAGEVADLSHWHYDTFLVTFRNPLFREEFPSLLTFSSGAGGRANRLTVQLNRDVIRAQRVPER